jgi:hypothetical protein
MESKKLTKEMELQRFKTVLFYTNKQSDRCWQISGFFAPIALGILIYSLGTLQNHSVLGVLGLQIGTALSFSWAVTARAAHYCYLECEKKLKELSVPVVGDLFESRETRDHFSFSLMFILTLISSFLFMLFSILSLYYSCIIDAKLKSSSEFNLSGHITLYIASTFFSLFLMLGIPFTPLKWWMNLKIKLESSSFLEKLNKKSPH